MLVMTKILSLILMLLFANQLLRKLLKQSEKDFSPGNLKQVVFHKRCRQLGGGGGVKNWSKLVKIANGQYYKSADMGEGGVKNPEKY